MNAIATTIEELPATDWYQNLLVSIRGPLSDIKANLSKLGQVIADALDHNPRVREILPKDVPELSSGFIDVLERIGRKQMLAEIYLNPSCDQLITAPISVQRQIMEQGIPVVMKSGTEHRVVYKRPAEITPSEARQALRLGNVRTFEEQVEYMTPGPRVRRPDWETDDEMNIIVHRAETVISPKVILAHAEKILAKEKAGLSDAIKKNQVRKK